MSNDFVTKSLQRISSSTNARINGREMKWDGWLCRQWCRKCRNKKQHPNNTAAIVLMNNDAGHSIQKRAFRDDSGIGDTGV